MDGNAMHSIPAGSHRTLSLSGDILFCKLRSSGEKQTSSCKVYTLLSVSVIYVLICLHV